MKNIEPKGTYSRSDVMKKAWQIFKCTEYDSFTKDAKRRFASCLERAWYVVKEGVRYYAQKAKKEAEEAKRSAWYNENRQLVNDVISKSMGDPSRYYANNRYNGD